MLKTNNTCQISELAAYINVSAMTQQLETLESENNTLTEVKTMKTFVLKARQSRFGMTAREKVLPEIQDRCKNEPLIKTNDFIVNETQFEKYKTGEPIFVLNEKSTRICNTYTACSNQGPGACGWGWTNPSPLINNGFTFHQVSDGSICVSCNDDLPGPPACNNGFCLCSDINNKEDLMDCVLDPTTDVDIEEDGDIFTQQLTYNSQTNARSVAITSPAHKDLSTLEVVMHAHSNGYWHNYAENNNLLKLGDKCHISTLPSDVFPIDIALGIQEIKKGNNATTKDDEVETQGIILDAGPLTKKEENALHSDIKSHCSNSTVERFVEMKVTKEETENLKKGKVILVGSKSSRSNCDLLTAATQRKYNSSGCWRWPNPDTSVKIWVHHIITSVIHVTCCRNLPGSSNCCADDYPEYCECEDIVDYITLNQCRAPLQTDIVAEDLAENGTMIGVNQVFNYNRDNGGSMKIEVEAHKDYEKSTMIFNDTMTVLQRGDGPCTVINTGIPPLQIALDAAEIKKTHGEQISLQDQTRQDRVLVTSEEVPEVSGELDACQNYTSATFLPISSEQFESLNSGDVIIVEDPLSAQAVRGISPGYIPDCSLQTACATNNGSSCFRFPTPQGETIYVHDVVSSPICLKCCTEGQDPNHCDCSDITDVKSFEFCIGPRPEALFVATGVDGNSESFSSVEILTKDKFGNYESRNQAGCHVENFPFLTSSATGALFNDLIHVCVGYTKDEPNSECFGLKADGSWQYAFSLEKPLKSGGVSVSFGNWEESAKPWWIIGGDPDGTSTEVWGGNPPAEIPNEIQLPLIINQPCMTKISDHEAFVTAIPKFEAATSNFAWIFNIRENSWTRLNNTLEKRSGPACGFLKSENRGFVVLAGGYKSSTTEILNLDTQEWVMGPDIGTDMYGGSMVAVSDEQELLLIGGFSTVALSQILRMNASMASWEPAGSLNSARFNAVAVAVPLENLPPRSAEICL